MARNPCLAHRTPRETLKKKNTRAHIAKSVASTCGRTPHTHNILYVVCDHTRETNRDEQHKRKYTSPRRKNYKTHINSDATFCVRVRAARAQSLAALIKVLLSGRVCGGVFAVVVRVASQSRSLAVPKTRTNGTDGAEKMEQQRKRVCFADVRGAAGGGR